MFGTLTLPTGTSLQLSLKNSTIVAGTPKSARKMSFAGRNLCKASVQAFDTAPAVETRMPASLYEVLRVKRNASPVEIKTAYRSLAKMYHPDSSRSDSSDGRDFIEIHKAYATLSDPAARTIYDLTLSIGSGRRPVRYASAGNRSGVYRSRRWETDQCW